MGMKAKFIFYIIVWCYVEVDVPSLTGTKFVMRTVLHGEVDQDDMFVLQSNAMSELISSSLTGIKTTECLSGERPSILCIQ